jgi:hypothetical protein
VRSGVEGRKFLIAWFFKNNGKAELFATSSRTNSLLIGISANPGKYLKDEAFFGYPQLWITLFVTALIFLYKLATYLVHIYG